MRHLYEFSSFDDINKKQILTLGDLRKMVEEGNIDLITMELYSYGDWSTVDMRSEIEDVVIKDRDGYTIVEWHWHGGDPSISLDSEDEKIEKTPDDSAYDFGYTLYTTHPMKISTGKYNL